MQKIDESTAIPLNWVAIILTTILVPTALGAMWVKSVNDRLGRIEDKLGIHPYAASPAILQEARATEE